MPEMMADAVPLKKYFGGAAYSFYYLKLLLFGRSQYQLDAEVDGKKWPKQPGENYSIVTDIFDHLNGKFCG